MFFLLLGAGGLLLLWAGGFLLLGLVGFYCRGLVGFYCWWAGVFLLLWLVVRQVSSKPNPLDQDSPDHFQTHGIC